MELFQFLWNTGPPPLPFKGSTFASVPVVGLYDCAIQIEGGNLCGASWIQVNAMQTSAFWTGRCGPLKWARWDSIIRLGKERVDYRQMWMNERVISWGIKYNTPFMIFLVEVASSECRCAAERFLEGPGYQSHWCSCISWSSNFHWPDGFASDLFLLLDIARPNTASIWLTAGRVLWRPVLKLEAWYLDPRRCQFLQRWDCGGMTRNWLEQMTTLHKPIPAETYMHWVWVRILCIWMTCITMCLRVFDDQKHM
jgi:hypothetical protein